MFRKTRFRVGLAVIAVLLVVPLLVAMGSPQGPPGGDGGLARDAESYASDTGVSEEEALRRLILQDEVGDLNAQLVSGEQGAFGGLWIEHTPEFKVVVGFTDEGAARLSRYEKSTALREVLETADVDISLEALESKQADATVVIGRTSIITESSIMVKDNLVEVYTLDADGLKQALDEVGEQLPEKVVVKEVEGLSTLHHVYDIHGGEALLDCTTGFSVRHSDGTEGISTAGHCRDYQLSPNPPTGCSGGEQTVYAGHGKAAVRLGPQ